MKIRRFLSSIVLVAIISVFSGFVVSYRATEVAYSSEPPPIKAENFKNPPQTVSSNNALAFGDIAWKTFITLNWPANPDGSPIEEATLDRAPSAPRVWEFYRTPEEVFLPNGENPSLNVSNPFARTLKIDLIKGQGSGSPGDKDLEKNLQDSRAWIEKILKSGACPANLTLCPHEEKLLLNNIPLVDKQGNYVIIEVHLNRHEFKQIVDNKWYDSSKLDEYNKKNNLEFKSTESSTDAPIEVKAAWRVFDEKSSPKEKARYYTTKRFLAIPKEQYVCTTDNCNTDDPILDEVEVGLIGFHLAYKIPEQQSSTPGWIWATFEQVDNLKVDNPPSGVDLKPTLSNPDCEKNPDRQMCKPNYPNVEWPFLWRDISPHAVTVGKDGKIAQQIPTQVVRLSEKLNCPDGQLSESEKEALKQQNKNWQGKFGKDSVWQYYKLVGTQWMENPPVLSQDSAAKSDELISKIKERIKPGPLFNVAMEAYSQTQVNGDSCISCHVTAIVPSFSDTPGKAMSDFSFLLQRAESSNKKLSKDEETGS